MFKINATVDFLKNASIADVWLRFGTKAAIEYVLKIYTREEASYQLQVVFALDLSVRALIDNAPLEYEALASFVPMVCPKHGEFIAYKKGCSLYKYLHDDYEEPYPDAAIITLKIPANAKRSSASGRKCRASEAEVLQIEEINPKREFKYYSKHARSLIDSSFIYHVGEIVKPIGEKFDENRFHECAPGIHFFMTKQEAIDYY